MPSFIKLGLVLLATQFVVITAEARNEEESFLLLRQAMMESNADYNKHKKKMNHEEMDRVEEWGNRDSDMIVINGKAAKVADLSDFKTEQPYDEANGREISSNTAPTPSTAEEVEEVILQD